MTPDKKDHWTVKAARLGLAFAALSSQVGDAACGRKNPDVSPPPTTSSETTSTPFITPPVSLEPMIAETPVPGETLAPTETAPMPVWSAPTLEQMQVEGRGGQLPEDIAQYKFEEVIPNGLARIGIESAVVNFSDNGLSGNEYFWAPLVVNSEGSVVWAYDPAIGQLEWPVKLDIISGAQGMYIYSLHTEGLSYQAVPDSEGAQIVWGGTKDGISGKYLAVLAKDPLTLPDGRQIYSLFWDRTSQSWLSTPDLAELLATPTPEAAEIVWDLSNPEAFPTKPFEYLTSTEFAQQVLDWEAAGKFPEVPDTAVPIKTIGLFMDINMAFLKKYGLCSIYEFPEQSSNPVRYDIYPDKIPYILAGVWKFEYQEENAFFILKKWKNLDDSAGFEGFIYKTQSTNPKAITWELIYPGGFENEKRYPTGEYYLNGTPSSNINGFSGCRLVFNQSGNPDSAFCKWYYENPDLVFNKELYYRWQKTGILSNFTTKDGQKIPFIPISPLTSLPFTPKQ